MPWTTFYFAILLNFSQITLCNLSKFIDFYIFLTIWSAFSCILLVLTYFDLYVQFRAFRISIHEVIHFNVDEFIWFICIYMTCGTWFFSSCMIQLLRVLPILDHDLESIPAELYRQNNVTWSVIYKSVCVIYIAIV